ncbi:hypothetical protein FQA39_LY10516 [Lamprigera yunnana]|nr:hypothetical protein FQA39_LY10516 [Lamprigera yunnana]
MNMFIHVYRGQDRTINKSIRVNNISRAIAGVEEEYSVIHQVMDSHLINYSAMQLYLYLYQLYNEGLNSCKSGYISEGLINSTYLRTYLILKVEYLSNLGYQFTFSSNDIMKYYNYPRAHCVQHRNQFLLAIAIPLLTLGITQRLVIENDLDAFYRTEAEYICLDRQSQIKSHCLIRPNVISPVNSNKCLSAIWNGLSVLKYKENCKLIPSNTNAIWMRFNDSAWIYSGITDKIVIQCESPKSEGIIPIGGIHGNTIVVLSCICHILHNMILERGGSCFNFDSVMITHIHPIHVLNYESLMLPEKGSQVTFHFDESNLPYNLSFDIFDHADIYHALSKDDVILNRPTPIIEWTSPFHSTCCFTRLLGDEGASIPVRVPKSYNSTLLVLSKYDSVHIRIGVLIPIFDDITEY